MIEQWPASVACLLMAGFVMLTSARPPEPPLKSFTLDDLVPARIEFYYDRVSAQWISELEYIHSETNIGIRKYNAVNDTDEIFLNMDDIKGIGNYALAAFSKDQQFLLLTSNKKRVYRYSTTAEYAVYDVNEKIVTNIGSMQQLQAAVWGKDRSLAFVHQNNVYYIPDVTNPSRVLTLTKDGVPGQVYNGITDWIYEEEIFDSAEALWFSTNGTYLAVASFNDTKVESTIYPFYGEPLDNDNQYPHLVEFKYPKAGRTNPVVGLRVFKLNNPEEEPRLIPAPVDVVGVDHILGRVNWATDHNLIVLWLNRRQNSSVLINCDLIKDKCDMVQERTEPNGWIDITEPLFDKEGRRMVQIQPLLQDDQRFQHAARLDFETLATEDLSPGNSTVFEILGWNEELDTVFYLVSPGDIPWQRQVWATTAGVSRCVTCSQPGCHSVAPNFAPGAKYAIFGCSTATSLPKYYLYNAKADSLTLLRDNAKLAKKLQGYKMPLPQFSILPLYQDVVAHVKLLLPPDMNKDEQYPMIVKVYAGPGTTRVRDTFELDYSTYLASNRSFIVAYIDVRGSGAMGVEAMHSINNALGTLEVLDTLQAIRKLVKMHKFIDPERVGVWGWSYGGFTTGMMLIRDNKNTLACGAAVAPVTSWLYYDSIYTERYMDTPDRNLEGYQQSGLTNMAHKFRGRRLLLVHGSGDDNVHYQNSMLLSKRLQHLDIAFEQMSYTDENHSLSGVSRHLYHTLENFWTNCFE